jgi:hypothetical protein
VLDTPAFDILIVGSGPSGIQAAVEATARGLKVGLVDVGYADDQAADAVLCAPFWEIRRNDPKQAEVFLGPPEEALRSLQQAGAHLTPPRRYMLRNSEQLFPIRSDTFAPLQATSAGGLGVSWGANVFTMEDAELRKIGLPPAEIRRRYEQVGREIGVSGNREDDVGSRIGELSTLQPPLQLDSNASSILRTYARARTRLNRRGFVLGQSVVAVLSRDLGERRANPYTDMDFYGDPGRSVYRPQHTLESLRRRPDFTYLDQRLALSFEDVPGQGVRLSGRDLRTDAAWQIVARRLIVCAGAINSGRLVLNSFRSQAQRLGILCNPNIWIATVNLAMLGRPAEDARYSLAQLTGLLRYNDEYVVTQFYSYRSLLYFRVLPGLPLPPALGVTFLRLIETAFTCVNVHFEDYPSPARWLELDGGGDQAALSAHYELTSARAGEIRRAERATIRGLLKLRCIPLGIARPAAGASVHYAGTLPFADRDDLFTCEPSGRLRGTQQVYIGDGSTWRFLPAKGLTFTLMANARRVAGEAAASLSR